MNTHIHTYEISKYVAQINLAVVAIEDNEVTTEWH
jgi:hypothetical protein